jgi:hypothetical protein
LHEAVIGKLRTFAHASYERSKVDFAPDSGPSHAHGPRRVIGLTKDVVSMAGRMANCLAL